MKFQRHGQSGVATATNQQGGSSIMATKKTPSQAIQSAANQVKAAITISSEPLFDGHVVRNTIMLKVGSDGSIHYVELYDGTLVESKAFDLSNSWVGTWQLQPSGVLVMQFGKEWGLVVDGKKDAFDAYIGSATYMGKPYDASYRLFFLARKPRPKATKK